jgi:hypothetical protein
MGYAKGKTMFWRAEQVRPERKISDDKKYTKQ